VGVEEIEQLTFLRDEQKRLIKPIAEQKCEISWLKKRLAKGDVHG
jgi:hypothetical protein